MGGTTLKNSGEGGVDNTNVTPANSGGISGNPFDTISIGGTSGVLYDKTVSIGSTYSFRLLSGSTQGSPSEVQWNRSAGQIPANCTEFWARVYFYMFQYPTGSFYFLTFMGNLAGVGTSVYSVIDSTPSLVIRDSLDAGPTGSLVLPSNSFFRLDYYYKSGTSADGIFSCGIALNPYSHKYDEIVKKTNATTKATVDQAIYGPDGNESSSTVTNWMAHPAFSDVGPIAPVKTARYPNPITRPSMWTPGMAR